jgi:uncharacterized membrane protein YhdT
MKPGKYRIIEALSITLILVAELLLSYILVWLIEGHGVIACGKGVFDNPNWFVYVILLLGIPLSVIGGAGILFFWCSGRRLCGTY